MAIERIEMKDFLVFRGEFALDFCPGVNVIIGGNATGKTTLIKALYRLCNYDKYDNTADYFFSIDRYFDYPFEHLKMKAIKDNNYTQICIKSLQQNGFDGTSSVFFNGKWVLYDSSEYLNDYSNVHSAIYGDLQTEVKFITENFSKIPSIFVPANNIISQSKGIIELFNEYELDFDVTQIDIISNLSRPMTKILKSNCQKVTKKLGDLIDGEVLIEGDRFFIKKKSGLKIEFNLEASGFVRLGVLWKLLRNGLLEDGSVLFWDELENSLNPELMSDLADILLELSRGGVQIFLATHNEILANYFDINRQKGDKVMFASLYKNGDGIKANTSDRFDFIEPNKLTEESVKQYEKEIEKRLNNED